MWPGKFIPFLGVDKADATLEIHWSKMQRYNNLYCQFWLHFKLKCSAVTSHPLLQTLMCSLKCMYWNIFSCLHLLLFTVAATDYCPDKGYPQGTAVISNRLKKKFQKIEISRNDSSRIYFELQKCSPLHNSIQERMFHNDSVCRCASVPHSKMSVSNGTRW